MEAGAAEILGSLAECFLIRGERENSRKIVEEYRNVKFNRHSAFKAEVDAVRSASWLL